MIIANDGKWRVSVEGQIDMPFDTMQEALDWGAAVEADGLECFMYYSGDKPKEPQQ